jgi:hypothetical protein
LKSNPTQLTDSTIIRSDFVKLLNSNSSVISISDLFPGMTRRPEEAYFSPMTAGPIQNNGEVVSPDPNTEQELVPFGFAPIAMTIRVPVALQRLSNRLTEFEHGTQKIEQFHIVYDGNIVTYAAEIDPDLPTSDMLFADVRDSFKALISSQFRTHEIPPHVTHSRIMVGPPSARPSADSSLVFLPWKSEFSAQSILRSIYSDLDLELPYLVTDNAIELSETKRKIIVSQASLTKSLGRYMSTQWYSVRTRRATLTGMRKGTVELLELLSQYDEQYAAVRKGKRDLQNMMRQDRLFGQIARAESWLDEIDDEPINTETMIHVLEHVRAEAETSLTSSFTYKAGLVGAIAGAIATILISYLVSNGYLRL